MTAAVETSPYDIEPPFTWNGSDETKLREILVWVEHAPRFHMNLPAIDRAHFSQVDYELCNILLNKEQRSRRSALAGHPAPTTCREDAKRMVETRFPGFWHTSGLCGLSGHASIGPDFNGSRGADLRNEWDEDVHHDGFHADLKPGDGPSRECMAILSCLIQADLAARERGGAIKDALR